MDTPISEDQTVVSPQYEVTNADLREALDQVALDTLRPVLPALGILFAFFAIAHAFFLRPQSARIMSPLAGVTALAMFAVYFFLTRRPVQARWTHPIGVAMAGLALLNGLLHLILEGDPLQTTNIVLLVIGIGFLLLSTRWWLVIVGAVLVAWIACAVILPPSRAWQHFGFALFSATLLSFAVHAARLKTMRRLESLRLQGNSQRASLESALALAQKSRRSLEMNIAVGQRIASILNVDVLLTEVAALIRGRFGCYYVGIFLTDESGDYVIERAGSGGEASRPSLQAVTRLKIGQEGVIGWVAHSHRSARIDDVSRDVRYIPVETLSQTRSELALPLLAGKTLLGVLDIESEQVAAFSREDVQVFQSLADQVAIAIQNALLYEGEKTRRRLSDTLYEVGHALSGTLDPKKVLDLILEYMAEIVPYDRASMMLPTANGEAMEFVASSGFPPGAAPHMRILIKENDLYHRIYTTRQPLLIPDVSQWPGWQYVQDLPPARAWMGVPLIRLDQVVGMLSLTRERPTPYSDNEMSLAITFAGQAAVALENARLYDQLSRAYEQLERLDRTKSDFIRVVAHELRTPLTVLSGYSQILLNDDAIQGNEVHRQLADSINAGAARLYEIVNTMLDMTKIDSHTLEFHIKKLSVAIQIKNVCDKLETARMERNLTLHVDALDDLPEIEADADLLRKAFYQLIINAIKYTPDGGAINVSGLAVEPGQQGLADGGVEIIISDNGIGIDPQFHDLIFEKFFQTGEVALHSTGKTKFKGGGPGLGLAIVKGIVETHSGRVWAESLGYDEASCPGSHFHILLPLRPTPRPALPPEPA